MKKSEPLAKISKSHIHSPTPSPLCMPSAHTMYVLCRDSVCTKQAQSHILQSHTQYLVYVFTRFIGHRGVENQAVNQSSHSSTYQPVDRQLCSITLFNPSLRACPAISSLVGYVDVIVLTPFEFFVYLDVHDPIFFQRAVWPILTLVDHRSAFNANQRMPPVFFNIQHPLFSVGVNTRLYTEQPVKVKVNVKVKVKVSVNVNVTSTSRQRQGQRQRQR